MKDEIGKTISNITVQVLDALLGIPEGLANFAFDRSTIYRAIESGHDREWTVGAIGNFFGSLRRRKYIEVIKDSSGNESFTFTNKAKLKVLDRIADAMEIDGKFRFISFDIPERKLNDRNRFRRAIKKIGFIQIQKSLWVCNRNVGELVEMAAHEFRVEKYVVYIISEKTDIDGLIKKMFSTKKA
jgi:hypothetical protein